MQSERRLVWPVGNSQYFTSWTTAPEPTSPIIKPMTAKGSYNIPKPEKIQSWCRYITNKQSLKNSIEEKSLSRGKAKMVMSVPALKYRKGISLSSKILNSYSRPNTELTNINFSSRLEDYQKVGLVGCGSFGKVFLVKSKSNGQMYALKELNPAILSDHNLMHYVNEERRLQKTCNNPFIVKLLHNFDQLHSLFVYYPGGDLRQHIRQYGSFSIEHARIMICQIILAIEYLHQKNIIFRDLKPENVVLDALGHLHLTDFGLCKESRGKSYTFCGSIGYMAPEILRNEGHSQALDWYHLGVLLYELLMSKPPNQPDPYSPTMLLPLPKQCTGQLKDLLKGLLNLEPSKRLGATDGSQQIKSHVFFKNIDWTHVRNKAYALPIPKSQNKLLPQ